MPTKNPVVEIITRATRLGDPIYARSQARDIISALRKAGYTIERKDKP